MMQSNVQQYCKPPKNMDNPDMKKPHSHQPDENAITIAKCRHHEKKSQVNANAQLPDDAKEYIPSSDTCKRVLLRVCAQNRPREPQTLQELDIDGAWPMTTGDNPQPFLYMTMVQMLMNVS